MLLASTRNLCFEQKCEKYQNFYLKTFSFLVVKFSIYLNRRVFVMKVVNLLFFFLCSKGGQFGSSSMEVTFCLHSRNGHPFAGLYPKFDCFVYSRGPILSTSIPDEDGQVNALDLPSWLHLSFIIYRPASSSRYDLNNVEWDVKLQIKPSSSHLLSPPGRY